MYYEPVRLKHGSSPAPPDVSENGRKLDLQVIFTDLPRTAAALETARVMARGLGARITLMVARVVPYPLPLTAPDVQVEFTERTLESIAVEEWPSKSICAATAMKPSAAHCRPIRW